MPGPLEGIRVLDFSRFQQGPYATAVLADMGADVIKVEDLRGELGRRMWRERDGFSAFFEAHSRGKRSLTLDLQKPEAKEIVYRLVEDRDVVVENFRMGVMERLCLDYETLKKRNPRLIYACANGLGYKGPLAKRPAYDQIGQAMGGINYVMGGGPDCRPEVAYPGLADQVSALMLCQGILLALLARERKGVGQKVEVSLLGSQIALQSVDITHFLYTGKQRPRRLRASPTIGHFQTADGKWLMVVSLDPKTWPALCRCLGVEHLLDDERFRNGWLREQNADALEEVLQEAFLGRTRDEWLARLEEHDVPAGPVYDYAAMAEEPQVWENEYLVRRPHKRFGDIRVVGLPIKLSETPGSVSPGYSDLGEHNEEVLREVGYTTEDLGRLRADGVIA